MQVAELFTKVKKVYAVAHVISDGYLHPIPSFAFNWYIGEVLRGAKMLCSGTDPGPYITECTVVYEEKLSTPACRW